ncbi:Dehydrogenase/reductase SDR member 11 [Homalodisca vitripennis]|nr:Dehydrogenase/reductase SDR member 11 [Homalodisca vitripennis]
MEQWKGKVAIVTGASAGIGAAIAQALVHHGMVVVGLARRQHKIQELADKLAQAQEPGKLYALKVDLTKEEEILSAFGWVEKELGGADVLINNAGVVYLDCIQDGKTDIWQNTLNVNVLAFCICAREYLKSMEKRKNQHGHIVVINSCWIIDEQVVTSVHDVSVSGHTIMGCNAVYHGSKHAIAAITQCLRRELNEKNSSIKVTDVSPGLTRSEASDRVSHLLGHHLRLEETAVAQVVVDSLATSPVTQICEVIVNPIPCNLAVY